MENDLGYNFVNVPQFSSKSVEDSFLPVKGGVETVPLQRKGLCEISTIPQGDPYSGRSLGMSAKLAKSIHDSFGIAANELCLRESSEVSKMGALATAQGNVIRFAPGNYRPNTGTGLALLGHELLHVREQAMGGIGVNVGKTGIYFNSESEARSDSVGEAFASGTLGGVSQVSVNGLTAYDAPIQCQRGPTSQLVPHDPYQVQAENEAKIRACGVNKVDLRDFAQPLAKDAVAAICEASGSFPGLKMNFFGTIEDRFEGILEVLTTFYSTNPISREKIVEELTAEKRRKNEIAHEKKSWLDRITSSPHIPRDPTDDEVKTRAMEWATEFIREARIPFGSKNDPDNFADAQAIGPGGLAEISPEVLLAYKIPSLNVCTDAPPVFTDTPLVCTNELALDLALRQYEGISIDKVLASNTSIAEMVATKRVDAGVSPIGCNDKGYSIRHELGHAISTLVDAPNDPEIKALYEQFWLLAESMQLYEVCAEENERCVAESGVSSYAMTDISEFIAECYAESRLSRAPRRYAVAVYDRLIYLHRKKYR
jgi:hypothetical protein